MAQDIEKERLGENVYDSAYKEDRFIGDLHDNIGITLCENKQIHLVTLRWLANQQPRRMLQRLEQQPQIALSKNNLEERRDKLSPNDFLTARKSLGHDPKDGFSTR